MFHPNTIPDIVNHLNQLQSQSNLSTGQALADTLIQIINEIDCHYHLTANQQIRPDPQAYPADHNANQLFPAAFIINDDSATTIINTITAELSHEINHHFFRS